MNPYDEGYEDGWNDEHDNPYPFGSDEYDQYEQGHDDGQDDWFQR